MTKDNHEIQNEEELNSNEFEQMVENEILEMNEIIKEYNLTIEKSLLLIDKFYEKFKKNED